jgi:hypothetical protein
MSADAQAAPPTTPAPRDANDLRGFHFRQLMAKPLTLIIGGVLIVAGAVAGAAFAGGLGAAIGAVAVALIVIVVVLIIADNQAEDDFFRAYAGARGLAWSDDRGSLPPSTSLLRKGDGRFTEMTLTGRLPSGPNGVLAHYTYEEESTDSDGNRQTSYYHFTVVFCDLPECARFISQLAVQRRSGFRFLDSTEDKFRKRQRVEVESEAFDKRYEAFIGHDDDMNKARQILEPTFIVWLSDQAPKHFWFELEDGALCIAVPGQLDSSDRLDQLCAAGGTVARRLNDEVKEAAAASA